jgi:hypothetical protein
MASSSVDDVQDDRSIICFRHCQSAEYVACFTLPTACPTCGRLLGRNPFKIPPFVLPNPFVSARSSPFCVVVKPTVGSFLRDYTSTSDLHVGVTDSHGVVFHFDRRGVQCSHTGWSQCLAVSVVNVRDVERQNLWSVTLTQYSLSGLWTSQRYSETANNCFDFVLGFLQLVLQPTDISRGGATRGSMMSSAVAHHVASKSDFCTRLILPQTQRAARYIAVYRRLLRDGILVDVSQKAEPVGCDTMTFEDTEWCSTRF